MEASGLKTGSTYQKSHGGAGNQRSRRPSKSRTTKGQVSRFKANAAKFPYRKVPKQTTSKRTLSLLQAVNEVVKSAKVRFSIKRSSQVIRGGSFKVDSTIVTIGP